MISDLITEKDISSKSIYYNPKLSDIKIGQECEIKDLYSESNGYREDIMTASLLSTINTLIDTGTYGKDFVRIKKLQPSDIKEEFIEISKSTKFGSYNYSVFSNGICIVMICTALDCDTIIINQESYTKMLIRNKFELFEILDKMNCLK